MLGSASLSILVGVLLKTVLSEEVCYDDVGCFTDEGCHWLGFPPESPVDVGTRFYLYTRRNMHEPQELISGDVERLRASNFDPKKKTKFSVHGYTANSDAPWEKDRKDALLEVEDMNVFSVDWRQGAQGLYSKCHQNTRVVGREIGLMIRFLNLETGLYLKDVHIIGMSLGGHAVGYAGEFQPGVGRITGLDPAGPYFRDEGFDFRDNGPECRLDPTDALFVDVIHTDGNDVIGAGQSLQMGHQDFYPNGGRSQAGCEGLDITTGCSHTRAIYLYTDTIRASIKNDDDDDCNFTAYPCESWAEFVAGGCSSDAVECSSPGGECAIMGYEADKKKELTGKFYLRTNSETPFCYQA